MDRTTAFSLICLGLALVLFPLTLHKPGLPIALRGDEPGYYLAALSLAHDRDLRCDEEDLRRLFMEYPFGADRLRLVPLDAGGFAFDVPLAHPLIAAPVAALAGANGILGLHMALLVIVVVLATRYLGRWNSDGMSALYGAGFVLLGPPLVYALWLTSEAALVAAVSAALYLVFHRPMADDGQPVDAPAPARVAASGAVLALAAADLPLVIGLAVPILIRLRARSGARATLVWLGAAALTTLALAGATQALIGRPSPYLSPAQITVAVHAPTADITSLPRVDEPAVRAPTVATAVRRTLAGEVNLRRILLDAGYALWGRHTGLSLYFPFAIVSLLLFLAHGRGAGARWWLLATVGALLAGLVILLPGHWSGGYDLIGNRYLLALYPAFLFVVARIAPGWVPVAAYAICGVLLGPLLFTPFGAPVPPAADLEAHARSIPLRPFPVERTLLDRFGDHVTKDDGAVIFHGRGDVVMPAGDEIWIYGGLPVELFVEGPAQERLFTVRNVAADNVVTITAGGAERTLRFGAGVSETQPVVLPAGDCVTFGAEIGDRTICRIEVRTDHGEWPEWRGASAARWYLGAALTHLGATDELDRDLYAHEWSACPLPTRATAGETVEFTPRLTNRSPYPWPSAGAARVRLGYRWLDPAGAVVVEGQERGEIEAPVPPDGTVAVKMLATAPLAVGRYRLVVDPVYEHVAWFADRTGQAGCHGDVEIVAQDAGSAPSAALE